MSRFGVYLVLMQGLAQQSISIMNTNSNESQLKWEGDRPSADAILLPSQFQIRQVVKIQFRSFDQPFLATVRGVRFYEGKVKYDVDLWISEPATESSPLIEYETRIYNVDSVFVSLP